MLARKTGKFLLTVRLIWLLARQSYQWIWVDKQEKMDYNNYMDLKEVSFISSEFATEASVLNRQFQVGLLNPNPEKETLSTRRIFAAEIQ